MNANDFNSIDDEVDNLSDSDRSLNYFYDRPGSLPGTISVVKKAKKPQIDLIEYNQDEYKCLKKLTPIECASYIEADRISWIDVRGLGNKKILEELGEVFHLHPLVLEDIFNVPQRPKVEEHQEQLLIITQMVNLKPKKKDFYLEQVSFILGENYLLTVQQEPKRDCFDPIRDRLLKNRGNIRASKADYLAYALWDTIIDGYYLVLEVYSEKIELLEDLVIKNPTPKTLAKIHRLRRELLTLRRAIFPQRNALNKLIRDGHTLIDDNLLRYLKDCYDHVVEIIETIEIYRELVSGLMDVYLSAASNKMNEVMKLLTVISTIFIPLTFIVGVYGMNFNHDVSPWNMPELDWYWGYPLCLALMLIIAIALSIYFWKKGWLN